METADLETVPKKPRIEDFAGEGMQGSTDLGVIDKAVDEPKVGDAEKDDEEIEEESEEDVLMDALIDLERVAKALEDTFEYFEAKPGLAELQYLNKHQQMHSISFPCRTHEVIMPTDPTDQDTAVRILEDFHTLLDAAERSPFGQGNTTIYDDKVRLATHIPAERIVDIKFTFFNMKRFLEDVRQNLFPLESVIEAKLLKLNIYQEGDFFVSHQDTPLSEDHVGSLVVVLPVAHVGGSLVLEHRSQKARHDFGSYLAPRKPYPPYAYNADAMRKLLQEGYYDMNMHVSRVVGGYPPPDMALEALKIKQPKLRVLCGQPKRELLCCAFYSDIKHEVEPVKAGYRLTLSYQLLRAGEKLQPPEVSAETAAAEPAVPAVTAAVQPPQPNYHVLTIPELKVLCRQHHLPVSGKKAELIDRLERQALGFGPPPLPIKYPEVPSPVPGVVSIHANHFRKVLKFYLENDHFLPDGGTLAFPCFHLYAKEDDIPDQEQLHKPELKASDIRLRGADAALLIIGARAKLNMQLKSIVRIDDGGDGVEFPSDEFTCLQNVSQQFARVELIEESFFAMGIDESGFSEKELNEYHWVMDRSEAPEASLLEAFVSAGYFGNEASQGTVYARCCLLYHIPSVDSEQRGASINALEQEIAATVFQGMQGGLHKQEEERFAERLYNAYWDKNSPVTLQQAQQVARECLVSPKGTVQQILQRASRAVDSARDQEMMEYDLF